MLVSGDSGSDEAAELRDFLPRPRGLSPADDTLPDFWRRLILKGEPELARHPMFDAAHVSALEKQNRLLRRLTVACFGLLVVAVACAADVLPTSLVVQEEFLVKDRNGTTRFEMVVNKVQGRSNGFHVVDMNGKTRIDIGITDAGEPVIAFLDPAGQVIRTLP